jgi:hypothetical protein
LLALSERRSVGAHAGVVTPNFVGREAGAPARRKARENE